MKRLSSVIAVIVVVALAMPQALAAKGLKRLGEDPELDGPPALDVTYLDAGRSGKDLEIRIGVANMVPGIGGYPTLPGIEWEFTTGARTFLAEAYVDGTTGAFILFEVEGDTYVQIGDIEGTYDAADGYIGMLVPLKTIGAKKGTRISGSGPDDVDAHVHGATTYYADVMTTTGSFRIR